MDNSFINNVVVKLAGKISDEDLLKVKSVLSVESANYDITPKTTDLALPYDVYPECLKAYLATRLIEGLSKSTIKGYELVLRMLFSALRKPVEEITTNDIRAYLYKYQEARDVSNATLERMRTIINTFFIWVMTEGYITVNPCANIKRIKSKQVPRGHLSAMELEQIRDACESLRDKAIIELFCSTGCRVSEVINIKIEDVDFLERSIVVTGKGDKTRTVYLTPRAVLALQNYLKSRNDTSRYLIVTSRKPSRPLKKEAMEKVIRILGEKANINRRLYPHLLRHTTATMMLEHGADITVIQRVLGHSNISTTMIYADVNDNDVKLAHSKAIA